MTKIILPSRKYFKPVHYLLLILIAAGFLTFADVRSIEKFIQINTATNTIEKGWYKVLKVVDGDTIDVEIDNKPQRARLIGIDTPESDPRKKVECFGKEAANRAKETLTGKNVRLEKDNTQGDKDKYNRLLMYVFLENGTNFNKMMISEGFALEYTYNLSYKYQQEFKQAEKEAREAKRGLWADNACTN